jgi:hypothetical protein
MNSTSATIKELMSYETLLVSRNGDQLWRFTDGFDGKPRFKVFANEPKIRTQIKNWEESKPGADYFIDGKYYATDYIVPKKYLNRIAKLLEFDLQKNAPRKQTEKQKAAFAKFRAARVNRQQVAMEFTPAVKAS